MAWVAGFYSGEGSCSTTSPGGGRHRLYPQITVGNTDLDSLYRCQRVIGGKVFGPYTARGPLSKKPYYALKLGSEKVAREALRILWPFLSEEKKAQAQRVLDAVDAQPPIDRGAAWATRRARYGVTGGNRPAATEPQPCKNDHPLSERYLYTNPTTGRSMWKCRACQRDKDAGRKR